MQTSVHAGPSAAATLARSDRHAIRALRAEFAAAANLHDFDALATLFAAAGIWEIPDMQAHFRGRDAIRSGVEGMLDVWAGAVRVTRNGPITRAGDGATGRTYVREEPDARDRSAPPDASCYDDVYVREDGRWRFARRTYRVLDGRRVFARSRRRTV